MIQLTYLKEGHSILLKDWREAFDKALEYLDNKMKDKTYEEDWEDWEDIKFLRRLLPIFIEEKHETVVGNTVRFDYIQL